VHAADAAMAQGAQHHVSSHIAAEALTEWLERVAAQADTGSAPLRPGQCLSFHATDTDDRWTVSGTETGVTWAPEPGREDVVLHGPMADLLLVALRRRLVDGTGITVVGDAAVWQAWLDNTPFESSQNRSMSP
jgi:predicted lipid carrier protein YhbT